MNIEQNQTEMQKQKPTVAPDPDGIPESSINSGLSARPKDIADADQIGDEAGRMEFGEMNEEDAIESGYTDENGRAVSMAKKDVKGHPTGAYTDIGAGRSSAVVSAKNTPLRADP